MLNSPAYTYSTTRIVRNRLCREIEKWSRLPEFGINIFGKSSDIRLLEYFEIEIFGETSEGSWYPDPPTL